MKIKPIQVPEKIMPNILFMFLYFFFPATCQLNKKLEKLVICCCSLKNGCKLLDTPFLVLLFCTPAGLWLTFNKSNVVEVTLCDFQGWVRKVDSPSALFFLTLVLKPQPPGKKFNCLKPQGVREPKAYEEAMCRYCSQQLEFSIKVLSMESSFKV